MRGASSWLVGQVTIWEPSTCPRVCTSYRVESACTRLSESSSVGRAPHTPRHHPAAASFTGHCSLPSREVTNSSQSPALPKVEKHCAYLSPLSQQSPLLLSSLLREQCFTRHRLAGGAGCCWLLHPLPPRGACSALRRCPDPRGAAPAPPQPGSRRAARPRWRRCWA